MRSKRKQQQYDTLQFRLARTGSRILELRHVEGRFPWYRLTAVLVGLLAAYLAFSLLPLAPAYAISLLALAIFAWITVRHRRVIDRITYLETFSRLLEGHIARLELDWAHIPAPTAIPVGSEHPFASDLNVTGPRSLHQLLDTTTVLGGSQRLADWLLCPLPEPAQTGIRQARVRELLNHAAFRLCLELNGTLANPQPGTRWDVSGLTRWLETHTSAGSLGPLLVIQSILASANIALFSLNMLGILPPLWIATLVIFLALQSLRFRETSEAFSESYDLARQLGQLRSVLTGIEDTPYPPGSRLAALCAPFYQGPQRPSAALRRIGWIASAASLRNNPFLSLILNILLPWDLFFAYQLELYKDTLRDVLPTWLDTWYELEALSALANHTALNPENTFPILPPLEGQPVMRGVQVGHPLIPDLVRVENDFTIQRLGQVIIITGSNMSGKSTFLRTLGTNMVLAYAGGTVPASILEVLPFRLFTSMNLADSLSDGISYFYAEVRRLKALLDQLEAPQAYPLFFLIDEIFRGTNNRERRLGSRAYTRALAGKFGAGLISTHDLELVHLAETIPDVQNYHFREDIQDSKMVFDYHIRPGASPTTNALRIMALAGLPVPSDQSDG